MKLSGAIFDVDGTLLDSMSVWDTAAGDYLRSLGIEPQEDFRQVSKSMSMYQAACYMQKEYGLSLQPEDIRAEINALVEPFYREKAPLKPGTAQLLERLSQDGVRLCVATATDRFLVEAALSRLGIRKYFLELFTCTQVGHGKDEPHIFQAALELLGTERAETFVFEDSLYAIRTAKEAGFPVAAVYDPFETGQAEIRQLADLYMDDLSQFDSLWERASAGK